MPGQYIQNYQVQVYMRARETGCTDEALDQAMTEAVNCITEDDAIGWFNYCGLFT